MPRLSSPDRPRHRTSDQGAAFGPPFFISRRSEQTCGFNSISQLRSERWPAIHDLLVVPLKLETLFYIVNVRNPPGSG
jgi:hypothetical protein